MKTLRPKLNSLLFKSSVQSARKGSAKQYIIRLNVLKNSILMILTLHTIDMMITKNKNNKKDKRLLNGELLELKVQRS